MKKTYAYPVTNSDIVMTFAIMGSSEDAGNPDGNPGSSDPEHFGVSLRKLYV